MSDTEYTVMKSQSRIGNSYINRLRRARNFKVTKLKTLRYLFFYSVLTLFVMYIVIVYDSFVRM